MSSCTKTIFKCDICGKESELSDFVKKVSVPADIFDGEGFVDGYANVDMCKSCEAKYRQVVMGRFALVKIGYNDEISSRLTYQ